MGGTPLATLCGGIDVLSPPHQLRTSTFAAARDPRRSPRRKHQARRGVDAPQITISFSGFQEASRCFRGADFRIPRSYRNARAETHAPQRHSSCSCLPACPAGHPPPSLTTPPTVNKRDGQGSETGHPTHPVLPLCSAADKPTQPVLPLCSAADKPPPLEGGARDHRHQPIPKPAGPRK